MEIAIWEGILDKVVGAGVRDFYAKGIQDDTIECEEACGGELGVLGGGDAGESGDSAVADEFWGAGEDF